MDQVQKGGAIMEYNNELFLAIMERTIKRLWIVIIILIILLAGSNAAWIYYESQFEETTVTQELDSGEGGDAIINDGVHINGEN